MESGIVTSVTESFVVPILVTDVPPVSSSEKCISTALGRFKP
jgi:hypothetical protein